VLSRSTVKGHRNDRPTLPGDRGRAAQDSRRHGQTEPGPRTTAARERYLHVPGSEGTRVMVTGGTERGGSATRERCLVESGDRVVMTGPRPHTGAGRSKQTSTKNLLKKGRAEGQGLDDWDRARCHVTSLSPRTQVDERNHQAPRPDRCFWSTKAGIGKCAPVKHGFDRSAAVSGTYAEAYSAMWWRRRFTGTFLVTTQGEVGSMRIWLVPVGRLRVVSMTQKSRR